jgi:F-type H+-transporting ATPase subunit b
MVDINMTLFAQILNFLILVVILTKVAYKPLMKVLAEREEKIAKSIKSAEQDEIAAKKLLVDYQKQLASARIEAQEIVDKATKLAAEEREASIAETRAEIERMRKSAQADIDRDRELAVAKLKGEVVALSMAAAAKIITSNIDEKVNEQLVSEFIDKLDTEKIGGLPC